MIRILIVEDELLIANYLKEVLELEGYEVVGIARNRSDCRRMFVELRPTLVCMDVCLKGGDDGIQTALELRSLDENFTLIYLTAHGERALVEDAQATRPSGYLVKPVSDQTIIATITTAITNTRSGKGPNQSANRYVVAPTAGGRPITVDLSFGTVQIDDEMLNLTAQEIKFLGALLEAQGNVVSFETLRFCIWKDCTVEKTSLKTLVWRIRNKLVGGPIIKTVAGFGYAIQGNVSIIDD